MTLTFLTLLSLIYQSTLSLTQSKSGTSPETIIFKLPAPEEALLWRLSLSVPGCPQGPGILLHAVVTIASSTEPKSLTLTSSSKNCPASVTLCSSLWDTHDGASSSASMKVQVVGRDVSFEVILEPVVDRELMLRVNKTGGRDEARALAFLNSKNNFEMFIIRLDNQVAQSGQLEISVASDDVPKSALGRKIDRKSKRLVPRLVASLMVSDTCILDAWKQQVGSFDDNDIARNDADNTSSSASNPHPIARLSFTTYGKITLSPNSIPQLNSMECNTTFHVVVSPRSGEPTDLRWSHGHAKNFSLTVTFTPRSGLRPTKCGIRSCSSTGFHFCHEYVPLSQGFFGELRLLVQARFQDLVLFGAHFRHNSFCAWTSDNCAHTHSKLGNGRQGSLLL